MTSLATSLLSGSWPWSAGELVVAAAALVAAAGRHLTLASRSDGDDAARAAAHDERLRRRAALREGAGALAAVAGAILIAWLALSPTPASRACAWSFAVGVATGVLALIAGSALELSARTRTAVAARISEPAAAEVAWVGGLAAIFLVTAGQGVASFLVGATTDDPAALWGIAVGTLLVAWFAQTGGAFTPATARVTALLSIQTFALAAATSLAARVANLAERPDLVHFPRLLLLVGALVPLAIRRTAHAGSAWITRLLLVPVAALLGAALFLGLFVKPIDGLPGIFGTIALSTMSGIALIAIVARVVAHAADTRGDAAALPMTAFVPCLVLAAAVVVTVASAGPWGLGLAAVAAAALLPSVAAAGFAADVLARATAGKIDDGSRAAASAAVAIAGWATLAVAFGPGARVDLLDASTAAGAIVGGMLVLLAASAWRRAAVASAGSNSTRVPLSAMIAPALLAAVAPWCASRLNAAAGGGIAAGALLCGATAAFLSPLSTAATFDRVVQLVCVTVVLCSR